jgi:hypothetical protein
MSLTLYHGEPNGPSLTVLAALFESGAEAELVAVDLAAGERHQRAERDREVEMSIEGEGPGAGRRRRADGRFGVRRPVSRRGGEAGLQPAIPMPAGKWRCGAASSSSGWHRPPHCLATAPT